MVQMAFGTSAFTTLRESSIQWTNWSGVPRRVQAHLAWFHGNYLQEPSAKSMNSQVKIRCSTARGLTTHSVTRHIR